MRDLLVAVFVLVASLATARGESIRAEAAALGWQTEHAHDVVIATAERDDASDGGRELTLRIDETIRGPLAAGTTAVVVVAEHGDAKPWSVGARYLAFLDEAPAVAGRARRLRLVSGAYGLRAITGDGPESRFPGIVRSIASTLDATGAVQDASTLRTLLVGWIEDADPGIQWSAATDLVRHEDLHAALTDGERERIVAAYRRCPIGKRTKDALAFAAAATRHPSAAGALVETLLLPDAKYVRGAVAEALRRLHDPASDALLGKALTTADAAARKSLLVALGAVGTQASVTAARRSLADDEASVRGEAAHALGLIARTVREIDAAARIEGRQDLEHVVVTAKTDDESRAALWALAQLDQQEAWAILRRVAADEKTPDSVRKMAARYLETPRVSLLIE